MKIAPIAAFAMLLFVPAVMLAQSSSPTATVTAFYKYDRTHSQVLNRRNIDARSKWLTPAFVRELREEEAREAAESKLHPDEKPYYGDGFKFQVSEEYFKEHGVQCRLGMRVTGEQIRKSSAHVTVRFGYAKPCEANAENWKLLLINTHGKWLVNDIIYPDGKSYRKQIRPDRAN